MRLMLLLMSSMGLVLSANILSITTSRTKNDHIFYEAVLKTLAKRGHQIFSYTVFPPVEPVNNYNTHILKQPTDEEENMSTRQHTLEKDYKFMNDIVVTWHYRKYQLIILDLPFNEEALLGLALMLSVPIIVLQVRGSSALTNYLAGNSLSLSTVPEKDSYYSDEMSYFERFNNMFSAISTLRSYYKNHLPAEEKIKNKLFHHMHPTLESIIQEKVALYFNNFHPTVNYAQTYTPNIIPIGGIHVETNIRTDSLLPSVTTFLNGATEAGVIYFSLGSFEDRPISEHEIDIFIDVFADLAERVLWQTDIPARPYLPQNVMTVSWVHQQKVLAHPLVRLFVTYGGQFSQYEAINEGVPVVCIPYSTEQKRIAKFYEAKGVGVTLPFNSISKDTLQDAIVEVLQNPEYSNNSQRLSSLYKDRPLSAAKTLVFWVEYVLRHKGASHLQPSRKQLSWDERALTDIFIYFFLSCFLVITACRYFGQMLLNSWRSHVSNVPRKINRVTQRRFGRIAAQRRID